MINAPAFAKRLQIVLAAILVCLPLNIKAQITVEEAVQSAFENNIALQKSSLDLESAAYTAKHLWAQLFPTLSAGASVTYGTALFAEGTKFGEDAFGYTITGGLKFTLNAGLPASLRLIKLAYETKLLSYEDAKKSLEAQVEKAFYTLIAQKENLGVLRDTLKMAEDQRGRLAVSFANGLVSERVNLQGQLAAATANLNLLNAETTYNANLRDFFLLIGIQEATDIEGKIEISEFNEDPEALIVEYLDKRPDIRQQKQAIEKLELEEKKSKYASRAPSLALGFTGTYSEKGWNDNLSGSIVLDIPLESWIPGTKSYQSLREAGTEIEKAKLDLKNTENAARNDIRNIAASLRSSWQGIETARLRENIANRNYNVTAEGFRLGSVSLSDLEDARDDLAGARQARLAAESAYKGLLLDLDRALNR